MEERNHQGDERKEGGKLLGSRTPVDDKEVMLQLCAGREGIERKTRRGKPASERAGAKVCRLA
jgi:hypothetical protein